jgi:conserverd hypothetical protein
MKTVMSFLMIILSGGHAHAMDGALVSSTVLLSAPSFVSSEASGSFDNSRKEILAAKEDAVAFLATEGNLRGVRFQQALLVIRTQVPGLHMSDMELAREILAYE